IHETGLSKGPPMHHLPIELSYRALWIVSRTLFPTILLLVQESFVGSRDLIFPRETTPSDSIGTPGRKILSALAGSTRDSDSLPTTSSSVSARIRIINSRTLV